MDNAQTITLAGAIRENTKAISELQKTLLSRDPKKEFGYGGWRQGATARFLPSPAIDGAYLNFDSTTFKAVFQTQISVQFWRIFHFGGRNTSATGGGISSACFRLRFSNNLNFDRSQDYYTRGTMFLYAANSMIYQVDNTFPFNFSAIEVTPGAMAANSAFVPAALTSAFNAESSRVFVNAVGE